MGRKLGMLGLALLCAAVGVGAMMLIPSASLPHGDPVPHGVSVAPIALLLIVSIARRRREKSKNNG